MSTYVTSIHVLAAPGTGRAMTAPRISATTVSHAVSQDLDYPLQTVLAPGTAFAIAPGVYWVRMPLPFILDHVNVWLLDDVDGWTLVDTGLSTVATRHLWLQLHGGFMGGRPLRRVIVTHFHPDHLGMASWLVDRGDCELWMTKPEYLMARHVCNADEGESNAQRLAFFRRHGLDDDRLDAIAAWGGSYRQGVPGVPARCVFLADGQVLAVGRHDWRLITAAGHSPDHATLYCAAARVLIAGDQILPTITPGVSVWPRDPDANPMRDYLGSMQRFMDLPADTLVLPAHGLPFRGMHQRLVVLAQHHAQRFDAVMKACSRPRNAAQLLDALFRRRLNVHQLHFAMGEAVAHLNYLHRDGALVRSLGPGGAYQYERSSGCP